MRLRKTRPESVDINLTPLIDVVFLLLIFFMVSTTFDREAELSIELPKSSASATPRTQEAIDIAIDAQGRFFVNGTVLVNTQLDTLKRAMAAVGEGEGEEDLPVVINADARTPHQSVIQVMDAARQLGYVRLRFPTSTGSQP